MTERIANMMLCKTVVLSDWSEYLEGHFMDGQELILFDLTRIPELPGKIRSLLQEPEQLAAISEAGYRIAWKEHTWTERAKEFLEMVN
jgi:spore maturation protein CgeB